MSLFRFLICGFLLVPSIAPAQAQGTLKAVQSDQEGSSAKKSPTKKGKPRGEPENKAGTSPSDDSLPEISLNRDNVVIDKSVRIKRGAYVVADRDRNGVVQVTADNVVLDFQGATLAGVPNPHQSDKERFDGIGVAINGRKNVVIKNARIYGYHRNINAAGCDRLTVESCDVSHSHGQRIGRGGVQIDLFLDLRNIDAWRNYGAGVWLEKCTDATVTGCRASHSQNGILLAFCQRCTVHDNDASFNSGWGIGLWSSNENVLSWNHADFVNRPWGAIWGGDAAGLVVVNDSHKNYIVGNSLTYGGDGFFLTDGENRGVRPCHDNTIAWNDGSWSTNNAFEGTFSERNIYYKNLANDSRHGFWLGYSSNSLVIENTIERSGLDAINIGDGEYNRIERNSIIDTRQAAVHLSASPDSNFFSNNTVVTENVIQRARTALQLEKSRDYFISGNKLVGAPVPAGLVSTMKARPQSALETYESLPQSKRVTEIVKTKPKDFKFFREQSRRQGILLQLGDFAPRDTRGK